VHAYTTRQPVIRTVHPVLSARLHY